MTEQRIVVTAVPAGFVLDPVDVPVSVLVSPRLTGDAEQLSAWPDWVTWPQHLLDGQPTVTFEVNGQTRTVPLDTSALRPDHWSALFGPETFVRSHTVDDPSGEFVSSYDTRTALAVVQSTYQQVGTEFAIPAAEPDKREQRRRGRFRSIVGDLAQPWDEETGRGWRDGQARVQRALLDGQFRRPGQEGDVVTPGGVLATGSLTRQSPGFGDRASAVVQQWSVFTHQPQGADVTRATLDANRIDFHQALSAVHAHRVLQRSLGLVFDLRLPLDLFADTGPEGFAELKVIGFDAGFSADVATTVPVTSTAYVSTTAEGRRVFAVAPLRQLTKGDSPNLLGLLELDPRWFGVAQLDVDGALHKTARHAENLTQLPGEAPVEHPEVFEPYTTLSALRSGGLSLFADSRALTLRQTLLRAKQHNADLEAGVPQQSPFCAEDLTRGYRLDVWDSVTREWHSLHRIASTLRLGLEQLEVDDPDAEGFVQTAVTQAAPEADGTRASTDLHLHEAVARWAGWSLSGRRVGTHLTRSGDPAKALPDPADPDPEDEPVTEFAIRSTADVLPGTLPRLRYGVGYRLRLRRVDVADNGVGLHDAQTDLATPQFSLPAGDGELPYLRYEPVAPPVLVPRSTDAVRAGSAVERLVIRTLNSDPSLDEVAAGVTNGDRHVAPPGVHVEAAERHGMLDGPDGRLNPSPAMWSLLAARDTGAYPEQVVPEFETDGEARSIPVVPGESADLPWIPDPLARAAAFRDLPGTAGRTRGRASAAGPVPYEELSDPQARAGTVTVVEFGGRDDWQQVRPFRLALADGTAPPSWDPDARILTVAVPKGTTHHVRMSSCPDEGDLELLGVWEWLREWVRWSTVHAATDEFFDADQDRLAHVLQLAAEGGHGMLTPPRVLTLVHAVQQPIGRPAFGRLTAQLPARLLSSGLQLQPETTPTAETELAVLAAWRAPGGTDAFLSGALQVHAASTAKVDLLASWTDPVDDPTQSAPSTENRTAAVDEVPLPRPVEGVLTANGEERDVGWYDADHDLVAMAPGGTRLGALAGGVVVPGDAMPRHRVGDAKHHVVTYTPVATSRYREYFAPDVAGGFTRTGDPVVVDVPASAPPVAPTVRYVLPTFGWERVATGTQRRSVRTGGGLRVYLERPWWSSGAGELLGVTLRSSSAGVVDREQWKGVITQWGQDPIWETDPLPAFPEVGHFPDAVATERGLPVGGEAPGPVDVAGHAVEWDAERGLWFCDLTVDPFTATYSPFVRLALARYQPHALVSAKLSRVVLADVAQLTPERALTVTASPFEPGSLVVTVSGPAATGPVPHNRFGPVAPRPSVVTVTVQSRDATVDSDLAWTDAGSFAVTPNAAADPFVLWTGTVQWTGPLEADRFRLLVREHELYPGDPVGLDPRLLLGPPVGSRLVYAETVPLDAALLARPPYPSATTTV